jgi:hypothetical protein
MESALKQNLVPNSTNHHDTTVDDLYKEVALTLKSHIDPTWNQKRFEMITMFKCFEEEVENHDFLIANAKSVQAFLASIIEKNDQVLSIVNGV